jgi:pyruvate/2-oxoglutarate/acetoin dehydrogenase E1 component
MTYKEQLTESMTILGQREDTIFIGQQIVWAGNPMSGTLINVPKEKMIEMPVMEDSQMGMSLGLSLTGKFVITFYPRWDFLICASNQLISHVDKIKLMSNDEWNPNMIIRVGKGSDKPIDPGHQHKGNYLEEYKSLCKNIEFHDLKTSSDVELAYKYVTKEGGIHVLVEYPELY